MTSKRTFKLQMWEPRWGEGDDAPRPTGLAAPPAGGTPPPPMAASDDDDRTSCQPPRRAPAVWRAPRTSGPCRSPACVSCSSGHARPSAPRRLPVARGLRSLRRSRANRHGSTVEGGGFPAELGESLAGVERVERRSERKGGRPSVRHI